MAEPIALLAKERILITGATGNVGLETLRNLMKRSDAGNRTILAGVRDLATAKQEIDVQPDAFAYMDFACPGSFDAALAGVSRVLLVRPPDLADVDLYFKPFVEAMKRAEVKQVVFLSLQGVENNRIDGSPVTPHHKIEKLIVEAGLPFTFLRPGFFMQNLSTTHRNEIKDHDIIFVPAGPGKTSFVDVRDVGAAAALVLSSPGTEHLNRGYELTGPEALSYGEVADILTKVLGRKITYRNPSALRFIWQKWQKENTPLGLTLVMVALYTISKLGKAARLSDELERLLKRRPGSFRQFAEDYRAVWMP